MTNEIKEKDIIQNSLECLSNAKFNNTTYEVARDIVLDYITNLQEENKILKENAEHNDKVVDKARWNEMIYKSRSEKALDKLYCYGEVFDSKILQQFQKEMEDILKGEDK